MIESIVKMTGRKGFGHLLVQCLLTGAFVTSVALDNTGNLSPLFQTYAMTSAGNFGILAGGNALEHHAHKTRGTSCPPS